MVEVRLYTHGPKASIPVDGLEELGPDVFIALEGLGTFRGVSLEERARELVKSGKDLLKHSLKIHKESTRRGHASITTSAMLQMEVRDCSRVLSMLLVAPPFGSYLQESQRRSEVSEEYVVTPPNLGLNSRGYGEAVSKMLGFYRRLVKEGVELEDARYILPIGVKTSLFASVSLETYVYFLQLPESGEAKEYTPTEVFEFAERLRELLEHVAPALLEARLSFRNRLATYPFPNPFKKNDPLVSKVAKRFNYPHETVVLDSLIIEEPGEEEMLKAVYEGEKETLDSLNPFINVITLEPMSLVAYHQAIRHRTVPTAVESIYDAVQRALKNPEENTVIPPRVKNREELADEFQHIFTEALELYRKMIDNGTPPSSACYIIPQALKVYVIRNYNGYNILYPQGFIGTRTCSYTQWEERGIAYKIWRDLEKIRPKLASLMGEKCRYLGFCPERSWCPIILKYHKYDDEIHRLHK
ncbi:MAG TPA: FAD-dependent thymidylate synthase [Candidatus Caldiarchaeum subterraneum]|uniref:FAD-dependent thymidylate synthase n=1 Tax=Caldiarchaeum subterraneum TaxID=311458 RepID=A0A832ZXY5_CALS0|nr:FAD-dependent thymidylate synthase [Candidatus Caldarchaeum subterraneum]